MIMIGIALGEAGCTPATNVPCPILSLAVLSPAHGDVTASTLYYSNV